MSELDPDVIFTYIAAQVPKALHEHVLVIGSLAAAYSHRDKLKRTVVNTKDADVVVQPAGAVEECKTIANRLLADGWRRRDGCVARASREEVGEDDVIRLLPPPRDGSDLCSPFQTETRPSRRRSSRSSSRTAGTFCPRFATCGWSR